MGAHGEDYGGHRQVTINDDDNVIHLNLKPWWELTLDDLIENYPRHAPWQVFE